MAYKTPEQMLELIREENLLTDACMTIIDGRNEFGFHAAEVPEGSVKNFGDGAYEITLADGDEDVHIPVHVPQTDKRQHSGSSALKQENTISLPYSMIRAMRTRLN